ncbi:MULTISPECIES: hypothetical protein [Neorhizobium]|uniref:hypothetical protein n=1 Tax=Neorhizobium TaxID=1525371 RepID=UPI000CF96EB0|nr:MULTISPECIES: hypothetical protein [Neorhizobium]
MTEEEDQHSQTGKANETRGARARAAAAAREAERKARAAAKLRENLMRRKSQARSRRAGEADTAHGLPAAKTDESS